MSNTKTLNKLNEQIAKAENEIWQSENRIKVLLQQHKHQERRSRAHRLIERGAIVESLIKGADRLTNEQIKELLQTALSTSVIQDIINNFCEKSVTDSFSEVPKILTIELDKP